MKEYDGVDGFIPELGATVRECIDCGALIAGGPTRCVHCAKEGAPSNKSVQRTGLWAVIIIAVVSAFQIGWWLAWFIASR